MPEQPKYEPKSFRAAMSEEEAVRFGQTISWLTYGRSLACPELTDKQRNYLVGLAMLGMPTTEIICHVAAGTEDTLVAVPARLAGTVGVEVAV